MSSALYCKNPGWCPICERETVFVSAEAWLRDHYRCLRCGSIPRFRALIRALDRFVPNWRALALHEFAPGGASSDYLRTRCRRYSASHYLPDVPFGSFSPAHGCASQDMEALTYADASFDVLVSQDVMEHLMDPAAAWREIARVLKPGGAHVFTVPWYPDEACTRRRAIRQDGQVRHLAPPQYHGNPVDSGGSLVTIDWGIDMPEIIHRLSGMTTVVSLERDRQYGIDGEFLEVFVSRKSAAPQGTA
ncbi:MAG TPA: SAM-dependent methyltransferase [Desulfovibrio sp.]|jgi:SAM-dependent methyltransferase|nr:SAM-dependent methyltransferase [Desulfovibrio sp.]